MEIESLPPQLNPPVLPVEPGGKLMMDIEGLAAVAVTSRFVGMVSGQYLAVAHPEPFSTVKPFLKVGLPIAVRYVHKKTVYEFETHLIDLIYKPVPLVFLTYPKQAIERDLRGTPRAQCFLPAEISVGEGPRRVVMLNISPGGCRIEMPVSDDTTRVPRPGETLGMTCKFPGVSGEKVFHATVRNIEKTQEGFRLGVEYVDLSEAIENIILQYMTAVEG